MGGERLLMRRRRVEREKEKREREGERERASELNKPCTAPTDLCNRHNLITDHTRNEIFYMESNYYVVYNCTWSI